MPIGLMVMQWNPRTALETKAQYPDNKDLYISDKTLLHILNLHGFGEKAELTTLTVKKVNIITYYSGKISNFYIILVLNLFEESVNFEQSLKEVALDILANIEDEKYIEMLPALFKKIKVTSS